MLFQNIILRNISFVSFSLFTNFDGKKKKNVFTLLNKQVLSIRLYYTFHDQRRYSWEMLNNKFTLIRGEMKRQETR